MLKRYSEVQPVITALCSDDEVLNELAMTLSERNIILGGGSVPAESSILNKVNAFDEATRLIHKRDFNIADARQAFDFSTSCWQEIEIIMLSSIISMPMIQLFMMLPLLMVS